jgi:hypothetical protein
MSSSKWRFSPPEVVVMTAMAYGLAFMLLGVVVGLVFQLLLGVLLIVVGTGPFMYSLLGLVNSEESRRREIESWAGEPWRHLRMR